MIVEALSSISEAAERRLHLLKDIRKLIVDDEVENLAHQLLEKETVPATAKADAIHVAIAAVQRIDYLLTWNCRHINNAKKKSMIRKVCADHEYTCPEICTPLELLGEEIADV
ncbi:MAG: hypothetical protein C4527_02045 [Candidatus Omnitrophota bacterium]|nr:MAG: hypothetical protein C4527_02045 [Candidatus Omnitrophota bacterium]